MQGPQNGEGNSSNDSTSMPRMGRMGWIKSQLRRSTSRSRSRSNSASPSPARDGGSGSSESSESSGRKKKTIRQMKRVLRRLICHLAEQKAPVDTFNTLNDLKLLNKDDTVFTGLEVVVQGFGSITAFLNRFHYVFATQGPQGVTKIELIKGLSKEKALEAVKTDRPNWKKAILSGEEDPKQMTAGKSSAPLRKGPPQRASWHYPTTTPRYSSISAASPYLNGLATARLAMTSQLQAQQSGLAGFSGRASNKYPDTTHSEYSNLYSDLSDGAPAATPAAVESYSRQQFGTQGRDTRGTKRASSPERTSDVVAKRYRDREPPSSSTGLSRDSLRQYSSVTDDRWGQRPSSPSRSYRRERSPPRSSPKYKDYYRRGSSPSRTSSSHDSSHWYPQSYSQQSHQQSYYQPSYYATDSTTSQPSRDSYYNYYSSQGTSAESSRDYPAHQPSHRTTDYAPPFASHAWPHSSQSSAHSSSSYESGSSSYHTSRYSAASQHSDYSGTSSSRYQYSDQGSYY